MAMVNEEVAALTATIVKKAVTDRQSLLNCVFASGPIAASRQANKQTTPLVFLLLWDRQTDKGTYYKPHTPGSACEERWGGAWAGVARVGQETCPFLFVGVDST